VILAHGDERHERALEPVGAICEDADDIAGLVGDPDPYTSTMQGIQFFHIDDILISTLGGERSGWLRADLVERVRRALNCPVEHLVAEEATTTTPDTEVPA